MPEDTSMGGPARSFPTTHWSMVLNARDREEATTHLNALFARYWKPVYACIRFGWRRSIEESKDLTQEFFASLLEREFLKSIDPAKGRFRHVLKAALKNFMMSAKRAAGAQKRGGDVAIIPISALDEGADNLLATEGENPDEVLDRAWKTLLLDLAAEAVEQQLTKEGKTQALAAFRMHYPKEPGKACATYGEIAAALAVSESAVGDLLKSARRLLRVEIRRLISEYALDRAEIESELKELLGQS